MSELPRRAVVGGGAWGTTLAVHLARNGPVTLLVRDSAQAAEMAEQRENARYLPGVELPAEVVVSAEAPALAAADELVVLAVPARAMRPAAGRIAQHVPRRAVLLSVAKGIEQETLLRMTQVIGQEMPALEGRIAAMSGPNLALEIAQGLPASSVIGIEDEALGGALIEMVSTRAFRLYRNRDVVGVELCGALKNIIAIAAGAAEQLGFGDNGKAGLITRGLAEMTRLGVAAGGNPLTFAGMAGLGDVVATCYSPLSRNHRLGVELARGRRWAEIEGTLPGVAEGAYTVSAALQMADWLGVEMPIAQEVHNALFEGKSVQRCLIDLLNREQKDELADLEAWAANLLAQVPQGVTGQR
ncbi:MAG: NAD(P)-dependent glycerol-3-phosphate dehydrogenase [Chloroflexota bacterium]|nr:NAD(P)-dependent glycerol-3-phosphate dehydrogenase [Chloroflexota bacterium]